MKICSKCQTSKVLDEFHARSTSRDGKHSRCKQCRLEDQKIYKKKNREYWTHREWRNGIRKRYGLKEQDWHDLLINQSGLCAICKIQLLSTPHVDHCHETETVRGLLCDGCNRGLGQFKDDPEILQRAIDYLRRM